MIYVFILGKNPTLAFAEIISRFASLGWTFSIIILTEETAVFKLENELPDPQAFLNSLGGTIKIARVVGEFEDFDPPRILDSLVSWCQSNSIKMLGFSFYNLPESITKSLFKIAKTLKNTMRESGKFRYLLPKTMALSSAAVLGNKLFEPHKKELLFVGKPPLVGIFETIAVQDIASYSLRDISKPHRDQKAGMLPPKLAQALINLAGLKDSAKIYDPFCGTGTIIMETLLSGFDAVGSDDSLPQVKGAQKNIDWLKKQFGLNDSATKIFLADATNISPTDLPNNIGAIVSELYLGPPHLPPNKQGLIKLTEELMALYENFLKNFAKLYPDTYVLAFPVFLSQHLYKLPLLDLFKKLGYNVKSPLPREIFLKYNSILKNFDPQRSSITYLLPDQKVGREIFILENSNNFNQ